MTDIWGNGRSLHQHAFGLGLPARNIPVRHLSYKNHAHPSLMLAYNAKFRASGSKHCDMKTQDGLSAC